MNKLNRLTVVVLAAASMLAVLGCWFLWRCPMEWMFGADQHRLFNRQLLWNALGVAFFFGAFAIGWKRWLKASPWLLAGWIVLMVVAQMCPAVRGVHRWVRFGCLSVNVQTMLWPVAALFAAWLCSHRRIKPWMIYAMIGCVFVQQVILILINSNRAERVIGFFLNPDFQRYKMYMQCQLRAALDVSNWFGSAGRSLRFLPCVHSDGAVSGIALTLGKWAIAYAVVLMGIIGGCLAAVRQMSADRSKRMYTLLFGAVLLGVAAWNVLQSLLLVPFRGCTFSLLGYGGTDVLCTWLGLGIALSTMRDGEEGNSEVKSKRIWCVCGVVVAIIASAIVWAPMPARLRFAEPLPKASDFGEFGIMAKRGEILAADGTSLANSVSEWQLHIDPQYVKYGFGMTTNRVVEAVSEGLKLPVDKVREIYENPRSRYILAHSRVEGDILTWCRSGNHVRNYGLVLENRQLRNYPLGVDAAHVTGTCNYDNWQIVGISGLEYSCRKVLAGQSGMTHDYNKTLAENICDGKPTNGDVVRTTIQVPIQRTVSRILYESAVSNQAEAAWAIVVKVASGEIAAMSAYPAYDPNDLERSKSFVKSLMNGAVQITHEPGGLMKPIVYALAVDAGCVKPGEIRDWSNDTFTNLCHNISTNGMWKGLEKFHFGQKLGEGMIFGEETGVVTPPEKWSPATLDGFGLGRGLAVTGVQLVQAYATLANGGIRVTPYLVASISNVAGNVVWKHSAKHGERIVSTEAALSAMQLMLAKPNEAAINSDALYAGCVPAEKPEYVVVVGFRKHKAELEAPKIARPIFSRIAATIANGKRRFQN